MRSWLITGMIAALLVAAGWGVWRLLDKPVTSFVIKGEITVAQRATLERLLSEAEFPGVLSTRLPRVAELVGSLSWTRQVSVRRAWPSGFEIALNQASPIARWGGSDYISASGEVLVLPDDYPGLPSFDVAVASPQDAMEIYRMLDRVASREGLAIRALTQDPHGEWAVDLRDGLTVFLGGESLNERMHRFLMVKRRVLSEESATALYVDARYASGVAVRYEETDEYYAQAGDDLSHLQRTASNKVADKSGG